LRRMRWSVSALMCALVMFASACAGKSAPQIHHYQVIAQPRAGGEQGGEYVLGVEYLSADAAYDDVRIVYRKSPYKLDYYHYHRWSAPPSVMVTDALRQSLQQSGEFRAVTSGYTASADVILRGRLVAIEEVDVSEDEWRARIVLDLQLQDATTGLVIWSDVVRKEEPIEVREPEGVARALSVALGHIVEEITPELIAAKRSAGSVSKNP